MLPYSKALMGIQSVPLTLTSSRTALAFVERPSRDGGFAPPAV